MFRSVLTAPLVRSVARLETRFFSVTLEQDYQKEIKDVLHEYEERKKRRQAKIGTVVSTKNAKTISVEIQYEKFFPKYHTSLRRTRKIMAHDEEEKSQLGDIVRIVPCRPMSARKRHSLIDIIRRPKQADAVEVKEV